MTSIDLAHYMGRDGIPYNLDYLKVMTEMCYLVEQMCRKMYPVIITMDDARTTGKTVDDVNIIYINGIRDNIIAAEALHQYDTKLKAYLDTNPMTYTTIPLYKAYYKQFLEGWYGKAPYKRYGDSSFNYSNIPTVRTDEIPKFCTDLADMTNNFMQLCNKVNVYGYDPIKAKLLEGNGNVNDRDNVNDIYFALRVDRAMRFFKMLTDATDRTFHHVVYVSMLPPLMCGV